jgi:two-component sensor histidine kinase
MLARGERIDHFETTRVRKDGHVGDNLSLRLAGQGLAELDHRGKNVLATVQTVATHSLDASNSMEHFAAALDGRIRSLGSTYEIALCRPILLPRQSQTMARSSS